MAPASSKVRCRDRRFVPAAEKLGPHGSKFELHKPNRTQGQAVLAAAFQSEHFFQRGARVPGLTPDQILRARCVLTSSFRDDYF